MTDPNQRREFDCFDDDPRNTNGWGYNSPNPYDNYDDREDEPEDPDEYFDDKEELG